MNNRNHIYQSVSYFFRRFDWVFVATVLIPTVCASLYFGLFASDVFTSESRFVVRSPDRQAASPLGLLLRGSGFSRAQDDSFSVQEYMLSRDALRELTREVNLGKAYADSKVDRLSRFAGLDADDSFEALHRYYQKMIRVQTDPVSSVTGLTVQAFTAEDAVAANRLLLTLSESLVNRLNERGRRNLVQYAESEVSAAETRAKSAALAFSAYRNRQGVVDPERQAGIQLQQVTKLQDELMASQLQLGQLKSLTPQNPQIPPLENRVKQLRAEVAKESARATGGQESLANKAGEFQRLALEMEFSNKQLASAMANLESARNEAQRQQIYLERIAEPSLPDSAQEPRRVRGVLATLLFGLIAWGVLSLLLAGIREHQD
jgi:capsular polysaccharide transport system permease protein